MGHDLSESQEQNLKNAVSSLVLGAISQNLGVSLIPWEKQGMSWKPAGTASLIPCRRVACPGDSRSLGPQFAQLVLWHFSLLNSGSFMQ